MSKKNSQEFEQLELFTEPKIARVDLSVINGPELLTRNRPRLHLITGSSQISRSKSIKSIEKHLLNKVRFF